jgi:hypothetical protein
MKRLTIVFLLSCYSSYSYGQDAPKAVDCGYGDNGEFASKEAQQIYLKHQKTDAYKYFDKNCNGKLEKAELKAYLEWANKDDDIAMGGYEADLARGHKVRIPEKKKTTPTVYSGAYNGGNVYVGPVLRDSFPDVSVFGVRKDPKTGDITIGKSPSAASGASISWNRNFVTPNTTWAAKGIAALPLIWQSQDSSSDPHLVGFALAPTFSFNYLHNSNAKSQTNDVDVATYGGLAELQFSGLPNPFGLPNNDITHYLRVRSAYVGSFEGHSKAWQLVAEYEPAIFADSPEVLTNNPFVRFVPIPGLPRSVPGLPIMYELNTIARYEHLRSESVTKKDPIFAYGPLVDRVGGVVALSVQAEQGDSAPVPKWVQQFTYNAFYSWLHNTERNQNYRLFSTSLVFSVDPDGHLGIKLSYDRGLVDETAQKIGVVKLGLTAKY